MLSPKVTGVRPILPARLRLEYATGEIRVFDMEPLMALPLFSALREPRLFMTVRPVFDSVEWANGADVDPERLYEDSVPVAP